MRPPAKRRVVDILLLPIGARALSRVWGPSGYLDAFARLKARDLLPNTIIDVGASDGRWTRECRAVFPAARYAMFDALAEHEPKLQALVEVVPGVTYWSGGLGAESGRM